MPPVLASRPSPPASFHLAQANLSSVAPSRQIQVDWVAFKRRYLAPDGRVIDTGNAGISHSEGQSYGMLVAVWMDDRPAFEAMWRWTNRRLRRPRDNLYAWRYDPHARVRVNDMNNATDGDLVLAWALYRGALRWGEAEMAEAAFAIARDMLTLCTTTYVDRQVLLPGAAGFRRADHIVLNSSYYAFSAFRSLSRLVPDDRWVQLEAGGIDIISAGRFGQWGLPPDWSEVRPDGTINPSPGWPPRFAWDAVRVPMYLAWAGLNLPVLEAAVHFWHAPSHPRRPPAWVDLRNNAIAPYPGHAGVKAVANLAAWRSGLGPPPPHIPLASATDYYGAALILLCALAASEPPEPPGVPAAVTAPPARGGVLSRVTDFLGFGGGEAPARDTARMIR